jgi:hypothetical protein
LRKSRIGFFLSQEWARLLFIESGALQLPQHACFAWVIGLGLDEGDRLHSVFGDNVSVAMLNASTMHEPENGKRPITG